MNNITDLQNQINNLKKELLEVGKNFSDLIQNNQNTENIIKDIGNVKCLVENISSITKLINESIEGVWDKQRRSFIIIGVFLMLMFIIPLIITFYLIGNYTSAPWYITVIGFIITIILLFMCVLFIYNIVKNIFKVSITTAYAEFVKKLQSVCKS
jgi:uncharacterized BrkB/YihY/UPF0761 family membrane protein